VPFDEARGGPITTAIRVPDESHVGQARRTAASLATSLNETEAGRLSIIVTELATNLARHAVDGEVLLSVVDDGVQVIALDRGPGIPDLSRALQDGFSTGSTPGTGLGAVRRQADAFDVYSRLDSGTVIVCRVDARAKRVPARTLQRTAVCVPFPGEQACGDGWAVYDRPNGVSLVTLADGLGHGSAAAIAAETATKTFTQYAASATPTQILDAMHLALRPTRGAAVAVALLDPMQQSVQFAGVGNISASIVSPVKSQSLVSANGIVGHQMARPREFMYIWPNDATLVLHSDGLTTHWNVNTMPGVLSHDLGTLTASVYRDAARGRDDMTVLALRRTPADSCVRPAAGGALV
jgi:anti-sigma regulatory factor (Ser/Thr protein kinase)